ncbi:MAG: OmpA family protein [Cyanobacteria bacterium SZAS-4]|nr:OmpA family protein [Cyanobacteria bacterium SZAS-4]
MRHTWKIMTWALSLSLSSAPHAAQAQQQTDSQDNIVNATISAFGYPIGSGFQKVNMAGTSVASQASGNAWVDPRQGATSIILRVSSMPQATSLGAEFLTYVLWTVSPDGTTTNLGEINLDNNGNGKLEVKSQSQTFAMIVTAEPYYAVSIPSQVIVLENQNITGQIYPDNSYKLMKRSEYAQAGNPLALTPNLKQAPLDMYEARNAVDIAKNRGAEQYAPQIFAQAKTSLQLAENCVAQNSNNNDIISAARQAIQFAEDARSLTAQKLLAQRIEAAKLAAAAQAKATAEAQAAKEAKRQAELTAAKEAEMNAQAAAAAAQAAAAAAQQKAAADIAAADAAAKAQVLQAAAAQADAEAAKARAATVALRTQLLQQLNAVLQTSETSRGLVVNMADVLFDLGKYTLSTDAQLKLAKLSGIIAAHPGLNLSIEGYTDNTGTPAFNMKLSQQRADAVRQNLITEGLPAATISSKGLGQADPIADNSTAAGRQLNRRVDIIVSGSVIGINIGGAPTATATTTTTTTTTVVTPASAGTAPVAVPTP